MNRITRAAAVAALAFVFAPAPASGHVTVQPNEIPAGGFKRLDVRVPNERDNASTKKVVVQFPEGFLSASTQPVPGWETEVKMARLAEPVEFFGEKRTERVDTLTFTANGKGIGPGQFQDFGVSVALPDRPDTTLTFKATQTYSNGEVVRWIGAPDSDEPAPQVKLTAGPGGAVSHGATAAAGEADSAAAASTSGDGDGGSDTLAIVALILGALGLLAGVAGLAAARRARATATA